MIKNKVYNWANAHTRPSTYEKFKLPSRTVPGQSEDIEVLVRRHTRGSLALTYNAGTYDPEGLIPPGVENWDFAQRRELADTYGRKVSALRRMLARNVVPPAPPAPPPAKVDPVDGA